MFSSLLLETMMIQAELLMGQMGQMMDLALDPFLENMLNIELEADAGGFEFANDILGCLYY